MTFEERIGSDIADAMRARDTIRLSTLRMLAAALKNAHIAARKDLSEGEALAVVQKEAKQRRDSIEQFRAGGRSDLVDKESAELAILEAYLPKQLGRDEIAAHARQIMAQVGAATPADRGKVMGPLMSHLLGRADGRLVNEVVTELLAGT